MAVPPREDGGADDRREARHRRIGWCRLSANHPRTEHLSGPVGHPDEAVNPLARHYSRFRVAERLLLTGHSHQAWPDVAFEAQQQAWLDAAELVDDKWERAEARAADVRDGFARLLGDTRRQHRARPEHARTGDTLAVRAAAPGAPPPRHDRRRIPQHQTPGRSAGRRACPRHRAHPGTAVRRACVAPRCRRRRSDRLRDGVFGAVRNSGDRTGARSSSPPHAARTAPHCSSMPTTI